MDDPIFSSVHSALNFAFRHREASPTTPLQGLVISHGELFHRRSNDIPLHGQCGSFVAGSVLLHVCQLMSGEKMAIIARYSNKIKIRKFNKRKIKIKNDDGTHKNKWEIDFLDDVSLSKDFKEACEFIGKSPEFRCKIEDDYLRYVLIARYFGMKQSMIDLANTFGVSDRWLRELNRPLKENLQRLEERAIMLLENKLESRGLC